MGMGRDGGGGSGSGWVHSSNFYVIMRDAQGVPCLYTAGTGVLLGTVRGLALQLAPQLGLKVFQWLYASPVPVWAVSPVSWRTPRSGAVILFS